MLESFGARIFSADEVGKRLMTENHEIRQEVTETFGVDSYTIRGDLNTAFLSEEIFSNPKRVRAINAIVHPRVLEAFEEAVGMARRDGIGLLVLEAALMYESGADKLVDAVAVVDAPPSVRRARVVKRDGVDPDEVDARMKFQASPASLRNKADHVIHNSGTTEKLRAEVVRLYNRILSSE